MFSSLLFFGLCVSVPASGQLRPPNFSPDHLPDTNFSCSDKVTGGYYADVEAHCQLFHVCVQVSDYEFQDFHFLCPNDTVFDQQHLVCTNWFEVDCHAQIEFFSNDFGVKQDEDININNNNNNNNKRGRSFGRNTGRGQLEVGRRNRGFNKPQSFNNNQNELSEGNVKPVVSGTPIPLGFTTTIRPPGQTSRTLGFLSGRNLKFPNNNNNNNEDDKSEEADEADFEVPATTTAAPRRRFPLLGLDGRRPKVKSNLRANHRNHGHRKVFKKFRPSLRRHQTTTTEEPKTFAPPVQAIEEPSAQSASSFRENLLAEIPRPDEPEQLFASPSSPRPFIFRGSPDPFDDDLVGSASTVRPFFLPTANPEFSGISQTPVILTFTTPANQDKEQAGDSSRPESGAGFNRFRSRPSPARFNRRRGPKPANPTFFPFAQQTPTLTPFPAQATTLAHIPSTQQINEDVSTNDDTNELSTEQEPSTHSFKAISQKFKTDLNNLDSDDDCKGPFCSRGLTAKRRPRVKSNLRARKRNFWQNNSGFPGASAGPRGRKFRRGRKQRVNHNTNTVENRFKEATTPVFAPTVTTEAPTIATETAAPVVPKQEADIFEDLFESNNDLIVSSSTVSSVVFRGSPTPSFGLASFDSDSGIFKVSPRPTFNNIGKDIDLGPNKFFSPNENVFVTSTESNKIFIGSTEESSTPQPTQPTRTSFPSFPVRPKSGSITFPFRPKQSFFPSRPVNLGRTEAEPLTEETTAPEATETTEAEYTATVSTSTSTDSTSTTQLTTSKQPFKFRNFNRNPKVSFSALFKRPKLQVATTTTTTSTTTADLSETTALALEDETELPTEIPEQPSQPESTLASVTKSLKVRKFPFSFRQNRKSFGGRTRQLQTSTTTTALPTTHLHHIITTSTSTAPLVSRLGETLSVESELLEDELENEIEEVELENEIDEVEPRVFQAKSFRRRVKNNRKRPDNPNIRVEFKKANIDGVADRKKFFVKPDGRKPRVKSNIRARLANKGISTFEEGEEEEGFRHSTKVDDLRFNGDKELEHVDNTEKRAIDPAQFNFVDNTARRAIDPAQFNYILSQEKRTIDPAQFNYILSQDAELAKQKSYDEFVTESAGPALRENFDSSPLEQPLTLQPIQSTGLPFQTTQYTNKPKQSNTLLDQILMNNQKTSEPTSYNEPALSNESTSSNEPTPETATTPSLSAFRALLSQTKGGFLLNTRDVV